MNEFVWVSKEISKSFLSDVLYRSQLNWPITSPCQSWAYILVFFDEPARFPVQSNNSRNNNSNNSNNSNDASWKGLQIRGFGDQRIQESGYFRLYREVAHQKQFEEQEPRGRWLQRKAEWMTIDLLEAGAFLAVLPYAT